jgi:hypothetical protein
MRDRARKDSALFRLGMRGPGKPAPKPKAATYFAHLEGCRFRSAPPRSVAKYVGEGDHQLVAAIVT